MKHRLLQATVGLLAGLLLAELAFAARDRFAFPHVNLYLPDAELGVRLEPGATQRISFSDNPVTSVRIGAQGFRGPDLPPGPRPGEVVVVGDSQVFGLGVEETETFSAVLSEQTGRPVVNAGVPTYGPPEFVAVARRLISERKPEVLVYTVNLANDLFEVNRPNAERHAEWDGWAVRVETAPTAQWPVPGRRFLLRHSHLLFAARTLSLPAPPDPEGAVDLSRDGFPSEGTWTDLLALSAGEADTLAQAQAQQREDEQRLAAGQAALAEATRAADDALIQAVGPTLDRAVILQAARGTPGDIVSRNLGEAARQVPVTAKLVRRGVQYRARLETEVRARRDADLAELDEILARRDALTAEQHAVLGRLVSKPRHHSVLWDTLADLRQLCDENNVELVVLMLPLDVQVSDTEWEKYGAAPLDMTATRLLNDEVLEDARALGARAVDPTEALRAAEPGAFLWGDLHMTPKGHQAVARVLADALAEPAPVRLPEPTLPEGRTWVPSAAAWSQTPENLVRGSSRARCETVQIAEWLRLTCHRAPGRIPSGFTVLKGDHGEARTTVGPESATLITPVFPGEPLEVDVWWTTHRQRLTGTPSSDGGHAFALHTPERGGRPHQVSEATAALCAKHQAVRRTQRCTVQGDPVDPDNTDWTESYVYDCSPTCAQLYAVVEPADCLATHPDDPAATLACAEGRVTALPDCDGGTVRASATGTCHTPCDPTHPCAEGLRCIPWQGSAVCR